MGPNPFSPQATRLNFKMDLCRRIGGGMEIAMKSQDLGAYTDFLLSAALRRCGNLADAEEREGFLSAEGGRLRLRIPHLTHAQWEAYRGIVRRAAVRAAAQLEGPMAEYTRTHRKKIPSHLQSVPEQKLTMPYEPGAMMFVFEAIRRGIHPRDLGVACPETVVVFD